MPIKFLHFPHVWAVAKKEFLSLFTSPIGYVFIIFFIMITQGLFFIVNHFFDMGQVDMRSFFNLLPWIYMFFIPAFSMGLWAEERAQGTIELLLSTSITERDAVLGKFLAGMGFLAVALLATFTTPLTMHAIGDADMGSIMASYVGSYLLGCSYLAIGLFLSSLGRNQVVAFITSVVVIFALIIVGHPDMIQMISGAFAQSSIFAKVVHILGYISLATHFTNMAKGVIDSRDVIYNILIITLFLMMNVKYLEARKWK